MTHLVPFDVNGDIGQKTPKNLLLNFRGVRTPKTPLKYGRDRQ